MQKIYNGNDVFAPFNAGLYGIDDGDDRSLDYEESKAEIIRAFTAEYGTQIQEALEGAGLEYKGLTYYSPTYYNFSTDSIDLTVEVVDEEKYRTALESKRSEVQALLDANVSYDGYMALTPDTFEEARDDFSIVCVQALLSGIDFSTFELYYFLVWYYPCESCELIHEDLEYLTDEETEKVKACMLRS